MKSVLPFIAVFLPFIPFVIRSFIVVRFRSVFFREHDEYDAGSPDAEDARANTRALLPALAGFSFSALLALVVVNAAADINLQLPVYYVLVSFLCYLVAFNQTSYKFYRWQEELENALTESASLSLLLTISAIILSTAASSVYRYGLATLAVAVWAVDHAVHVYITWKFLEGENRDIEIQDKEKRA